MDAGDQLVPVERLGDVIVGAEAEARAPWNPFRVTPDRISTGVCTLCDVRSFFSTS